MQIGGNSILHGAMSLMTLAALCGCSQSYVMHADEFYEIAIRCEDGQGRPIQGAKVEVTPDRGRHGASAVTGADGIALVKLSYGGCHQHSFFRRCDVAYPTQFTAKASPAGEIPITRSKSASDFRREDDAESEPKTWLFTFHPQK